MMYFMELALGIPNHNAIHKDERVFQHWRKVL